MVVSTVYDRPGRKIGEPHFVPSISAVVKFPMRCPWRHLAAKILNAVKASHPFVALSPATFVNFSVFSNVARYIRKIVVGVSSMSVVEWRDFSWCKLAYVFVRNS